MNSVYTHKIHNHNNQFTNKRYSLDFEKLKLFS